MKKTVAKINGTYRVVLDTTAGWNAYTVYKEWYDGGKHTRKIATYDDMASCLYLIAEMIERSK